MTVTIDYFYTPISGYAYLGEPRLRDIASQTGATLRYRPVDITRVFAATETTPPFKQSDARLSYRREDLVRRAEAAGLAINPIPRHWPTDASLGCRLIAAAVIDGDDAGAISFALLAAVWAGERNIADPEQVAAVLKAAGLDAVRLLDRAAAPEAAAAVLANTEAAIAARVFGSPTYVLGNERFWGQDRLDDLAHRLTRVA